MRLARFVLLLVGLFALGFVLFADELEGWLATGRGLRWLERQGPLAGLAGAGLIASDWLLPMPVSGVAAALGHVYGGLVGGLYALAGSLAGGLAAYGVTRALGERAARRLVGERSLESLEGFFRRGGGWAVAVTRALPIVPEVLCTLAGLARMPFPRFFAALLAGSAPVSFLFAWFGAAGREEPAATMLIAVAVPALLFAPAWWWLAGGDRAGAQRPPAKALLQRERDADQGAEGEGTEH